MTVVRQAVPGRHLTEHFTETELACRCCGRLLVNSDLVNRLEALRQLIGRPVLVNSGFRCPEHNRAVGGAKNSYHLRSMAADIRSPGLSVSQLVSLAEQVGFTGIGTYQTLGFVHVDVRSVNVRWQG